MNPLKEMLKMIKKVIIVTAAIITIIVGVNQLKQKNAPIEYKPNLPTYSTKEIDSSTIRNSKPTQDHIIDLKKNNNSETNTSQKIIKDNNIFPEEKQKEEWKKKIDSHQLQIESENK